MRIQESLETLKKQSSERQVVSDVMHMFAMRERTRNTVTVRGLAARMKAEGFQDYSNAEYGRVLALLAEAGFGRLEKDSKGTVFALKDIRVTLQSIGKAVLSEEVQLRGFKPRVKYETVPTDTAVPPKLIQPPAKEPRQSRNLDPVPPFNISFDMGGGRPVIITLPKGLSKDEIALLISQVSATRQKV